MSSCEEIVHDDTVVYWSGDGKKVHVDGCPRLSKSDSGLTKMSYARAVEKDLDVCSRCPMRSPNELESWVNPPPCKDASKWKPVKHPFQPSPREPLVSMDDEGRLVYKPFSDKGDRLPDFSLVGYNGCEEPIPHVTGHIEKLFPPETDAVQQGNMKYPVGQDSHAKIQAALDQVAEMPANYDGFRGVVLLKKGTWYVGQNLLVRSGVVLRGQGDGGGGTNLVFTVPNGQGIGIQLGKVPGGGERTSDRTFLAGTLGMEHTKKDRGFYYLTLENGYKFRTRTGNIKDDLDMYVDQRVVLEYATTTSVQGSETSVTLTNGKPLSVKPLKPGERGPPLDPDLKLPGMDDDECFKTNSSRIVEDYVPTGSFQITVEDASGFSVGDAVSVIKTTNQAWIDALGVGERLRHIRGGKEGAKKKPWGPQKYDHFREIAAIKGNSIFLNAPLVQSIAQVHGGGIVSKVKQGNMDRHCGVESLRIISNYDTTVRDTGKDVNFQNLSSGIQLSSADSWVRKITVLHVWQSAVRAEGGRNSTIRDCKSLDPVGCSRGGFRYTYNISASVGILVYQCEASDGRHDFAVGPRTAGPNVFCDCVAFRGEQSEPHHRWGSGTLYDNVRLEDGGTLAAINRGDSGTGHGWAAANIVFWNCNAERIIVASPETVGENNFAIGYTGTVKDSYNVDALYYANTRAGYWGTDKEGKYYGFAFMGDGHMESPNARVEPYSLFRQQLLERLGKDKGLEALA